MDEEVRGRIEDNVMPLEPGLFLGFSDNKHPTDLLEFLSGLNNTAILAHYDATPLDNKRALPHKRRTPRIRPRDTTVLWKICANSHPDSFLSHETPPWISPQKKAPRDSVVHANNSGRWMTSILSTSLLDLLKGNWTDVQYHLPILVSCPSSSSSSSLAPGLGVRTKCSYFRLGPSSSDRLSPRRRARPVR